MPWVLAAGFGDIGISLLAMLCAIAVSWLLDGIGDSLSWSLPIIGKVDLGGPFHAAANAVESWAVDHGRQYFDTVTNWIWGHAYLLISLMSSAEAAISHLGDQVAHIVTSIVPDAIDTANTFTGQQITNIERDVYGAAHDIEGDFDAAARAVYIDAGGVASSIEQNLKAAIAAGGEALANYVDSQISALRKELQGDVATALSTAEQKTADLGTQIGQAIANAANVGYTTLAAATGALGSELSGVEQLAAGTEHTVEGVGAELSTIAGEVGSQTVAGIGTAIEGAISTAQQAAESAASGALGAAESTLSSAINSVEGVAAGAAQGVSSITGQLGAFAAQVGAGTFATAGTAIGTSITDVGTAAYDDLVGVIQGVAGDVTAGAQVASGDLSGVSNLLGAAILGVTGALAARVAKLEECSVGVCDDSPNNFSNLLNDALGLTEVAGAGAFIAAMISDPAGTANTAAALIASVYGTADSTLDAILAL